MTVDQTSSQERLSLAKKHSPLWNFFFLPKTEIVDPATQSESSLGYVETGNDTIQLLQDCIRDGRHAMLVGPRGTGKSYMGKRAVDIAFQEGELGNVQLIEIQGDPNKPPSDYFDDSISFKKTDNRLEPNIVNAQFFALANREPGTNKFECYPNDPNNRILLRQNGLEVDRVVLYWDEGNRSSPAMLNAVLGLLAEGRLRRDGIAYTFPPISCILTRNPDGYDANSAKMPSPLIDRFALQMYVYNPSMYTFVGVIAPAFLQKFRQGLLLEASTAISKLSSNGGPLKTKLGDLLEQVKADKVVDLKDLLNATVGTTESKEIGFAVESFRRLLRVPDKSLESKYLSAAARLAVVVLSTWGDLRDVERKPGMQYLPPAAKEILRELALMDKSVESHLEEVGNLTRYGTSIRAFEEMLKGMLSPIVAGKQPENGENLISLGLKSVRANLGGLLGHRCETTFNPDREPSKAMRKSRSLLWLANWLLDDVRAEEIVKLAKMDKRLAESKLLDG